MNERLQNIHPDQEVEAGGSGQAGRRFRDSILQFEAYEEEKRREESGLARERRLRDEQVAKPMGASPRKKLFSEVPCIEGERIVLDRVVDADAAALRDMIDNPIVQRYLPTYLFEKQRDDVHETIALLYGDLFTNKESLILAVRVKETGELAGLAEFYGLCDSLHKVSLGCRLRERWWGNGFATEVARLMMDYLYGETDIEIITVSVMSENKASAHVIEKAGFIRTARSVEEDWGFSEPVIVDKWFCKHETAVPGTAVSLGQ